MKMIKGAHANKLGIFFCHVAYLDRPEVAFGITIPNIGLILGVLVPLAGILMLVGANVKNFLLSRLARAPDLVRGERQKRVRFVGNEWMGHMGAAEFIRGLQGIQGH